MSRQLFLILLVSAALLCAASPPNWDGWQFLIGEWVGEGSGQPGVGSGGFSLQPELDGRVLVRKNRADYPANKDRPAFSHQDLMVIYPEGATPRAIYFDTEGHVIHYTAEISPSADRITFLSGVEASAPRYRLTYTKLGRDKVSIRFEVAPPGKPDAFTPYIEATARRK